MKDYSIDLIKGGSLSSTSKKTYGNKKTLVKRISRHTNREYGFIRWYSQIKKQQQLYEQFPDLFPKLYEINVDELDAEIEQEWLEEYVDLKSYMAQSDLSYQSISLISDLLFECLSRIHSVTYSGIKNSMSLYFYEEIEQKLTDAIRYSDDFKSFVSHDTYVFNKEKIPNTLSDLSYIKKLFNSPLVHEEQILGNPTLENIMYNPTDHKIKFIDLYDESMINSRLLDYSMIFQCARSHYGFINDRNVLISKNIVSHDHKIPQAFNVFSECFESNIARKDQFLVGLFEASQFVRMLPFKILIGDLDKAKYFYTLSCKLFSQFV